MYYFVFHLLDKTSLVLNLASYPEEVDKSLNHRRWMVWKSHESALCCVLHCTSRASFIFYLYSWAVFTRHSLMSSTRSTTSLQRTASSPGHSPRYQTGRPGNHVSIEFYLHRTTSNLRLCLFWVWILDLGRVRQDFSFLFHRNGLQTYEFFLHSDVCLVGTGYPPRL